MKNIKKIILKTIKYNLYLIAFLLPIQTRLILKAGELNNGYFEYNTISLYLTDILILFLLSQFIFLFFSNKDYFKTKINFTIIILACLEFFIIGSIFFAVNKQIAFYGYLKFLIGVALFFIISNKGTVAKHQIVLNSQIFVNLSKKILANITTFPKIFLKKFPKNLKIYAKSGIWRQSHKKYYSKTKLIIAFLAGAFLQSCLGIWQFFTQSTFTCKWLGMAGHNAQDLGVSVIETLSGERWLRAYGGLDHPNMLGGFLCVSVLILISFFISQAFKNIKNKILFFITLIVLSAGLFFSFSRSAWLGLFFGLIVFVILAIKDKNIKKQKQLFCVFFFLIILFFSLFKITGDIALTRFSSNARLEKKSNIERITYYSDAKKIIKNHWLFGAGIGNYTQTAYKEINSSMPSYYYQPVHNTFLLILAEIGIFGFIFFLLFFLFQIKNRLLFPILVAVSIMFMFDHWWYSMHFGILLFWFILGLLPKTKYN